MIYGRENEDRAAEYFGLKVEHWALVRFGEREFVIEATDLEFVQTFRQAA
jgi:hypothetical protein